MGDSVENLSQVKLQDHPALEDFLLRLREQRGSLPPLSAISVVNTIPQDGKIELFYEDVYQDESQRNYYMGFLRGEKNALYFQAGTEANGSRQWKYADAPGSEAPLLCSTVHVLGGPDEAGFNCQDIPLSDILKAQRQAPFYWGLGSWGALEFGGRLFVRKSFTRWMLAGFRPVGTSALTPSQRLIGTGPGLAFGMAAAAGSSYLADALHLDERFHSHERFALSVGMGHGVHGLTSYLQPRFFPGNRTGVKLMSFSSGLLSSALVDATLGSYFEEGSSERQALRISGFFLPQIFRGLLGERALAFGERFGVAGIGKWGGRAVTALFVADASYMAYNYFSDGAVASGRRNRLYARANEIQRRHQGNVTAFFDGVAETLAPSLAQRFLVGDSYVDVARQEFQAESDAVSTEAQSQLRQFLLFHPLGDDTDPEFYRRVDTSLFERGSRMANVRDSDGRLLPVADVNEQLSDPEIYAKRIEKATPKEVVRYIQNQFRGHHLTKAKVGKVLGHIAVNRTLEQIGQLHYLDTADHQPLLKHFDSKGALKTGHRQALLALVFPELDPENTENQVLALRKVALVYHIEQLERAGRSEQAKPYLAVAKALGLQDASGTWANFGETSEIIEQGRRLAQNHPMELPPLPPPAAPPSHAEILQMMMAHTAARKIKS